MSRKPSAPLGMDNYRTSACEGKKTFDNFRLASKVAGRRGRNEVPRGAYHCHFCKGWHLGGDALSMGRKKAAERRTRNRRRIDDDDDC